MDIMERSLQKHEEWHGKIEIISRAPIRNKEDLSLAYTPGVARPCLEIQKDEEKSFELTRRANIVAVVTDGRRSVLQPNELLLPQDYFLL